MSTKVAKKDKTEVQIGGSILPEIYVLKRIKDRAEARIDELKTFLLGAKSDIVKDTTADLQANLVWSDGRKTFDPQKAAAYLKEYLGEKDFNEKFTSLRISRKAGSGKIPPKLLLQMEEYFVITRVDDVKESVVRETVLPETDEGKAKLEENCYTTGKGFWTMRTPSKISDKELVSVIREQNLDVVSRLLLPPAEKK